MKCILITKAILEEIRTMFIERYKKFEKFRTSIFFNVKINILRVSGNRYRVAYKYHLDLQFVMSPFCVIKGYVCRNLLTFLSRHISWFMYFSKKVLQDLSSWSRNRAIDCCNSTMERSHGQFPCENTSYGILLRGNNCFVTK